MKQYDLSHYNLPNGSGNRKLAWIIGGVLGSVIVLMLGMFLMYMLLKKDDTNSGLAASKAKGGASKVSSATLKELPPFGSIKGNLDQKGSIYQYDWKEPLSYDFDFEITNVGKDFELEGRTTFKPGNFNVSEFVDESANQPSTGTGFVIHPDGLILTCAHVVDNATQVDITLDKQKIKATVIAIDHNKDLALLRVRKKGLKFLPIVGRGSVKHGQTVKVFGFPLTDLLGKSIKVSSGTVTGFSDGGSSVQIDATVNPGNSGGPVVNEHGQVVGVASQLLNAEGISSVGIAVSPREIGFFLMRYKIPFAKDQLGSKDVSEVIPSVVFINVDPSKSKQVKARGYKFSSRISIRGALASSQSEIGIVAVGPQGLLGTKRPPKTSLPLIMQHLCEVGIEKLPGSSSQKTWTEVYPVLWTKRVKKRGSRDPLGDFRRDPYRNYSRLRMGLPGFLEPSLGRRTDRDSGELETSAAMAASRYQVVGQSDREVEIEKNYQLMPLGSEDDVAIAEYTGKFTYSKVDHMLTKGTFRGSAAIDIEGRPRKVKFNFSYRLVTKATLDNEKNKADERASKAKEKASNARRDTSRKEKARPPVESAKLDKYDPDK